MAKDSTPKLCLIDASGYIHRAYHALPLLTNSKGEPVHAVYGFSRMIAKVLKTEKPDYLAVCFDTPKPTFRHEMYEEYKGTRTEIEDALISQLPLVEELSEAWGLPCFKKDGYEADDVIATLARKGAEKGCQVLVLSGDKDILQLVDDQITVRDEIRKADYNTEKVKIKYGIYPNQLVDYFSLMGDKVDNVIGVPGVGDKTASKMIAENGTLEKLFENFNGTKPALKEKLVLYKENVFRNRILIALKEDVPLDFKWPDLVVRSPEKEVLTALLGRLEFKGEFFGLEEGAVSSATSNSTRATKIIFTRDELSQLKSELKNSQLLSYDLETDSADQHSCRIVGVALSIQMNKAWYIPVGHSYIGAPRQLPWEDVSAFLKEFLEKPGIQKVGQNLKFDNTILERFGVHPQGPFFDTMIAAYCLDLAARNSYGLKNFAEEFLSEKMTRIEELIGKGNITTAEVPVEQAAPYAAADAEVVVRLKALFSERLKTEGLESLFENLEMPLVRVIQSMEVAGIQVDVDYLREAGRKFEDAPPIEKEIYQLAGEKFLLNSPQQLSKILFEKLKLPALKKIKTGFSTNEDVLRKLASKHPICEKIIDYRELAKLISTYVDSLLELVDPSTLRVHTSFHQTGTATGRLSSTDPNLQNIPIRSELGREIRKAFTAPSNCVLLSADYSQIDLRSLAHMSGDPVLIQTFKAGGDIHAATAAQIFHVSLNEVSAEMRRRAKAINFGIVYGQQAWGLSRSLGIEPAEAQDFINKYFERYAGVRTWIDKTLSEARKNGFVTTISGRKRYVRDVNSENQQVRGFAERIAVNTPIQGTSADIIKAAMIKVFNVFQHQDTKCRMLVQVHDELLFEVPASELDEILSIVKDGMEKAMTLTVPLLVDMKVGRNWNDMDVLVREKAA